MKRTISNWTNATEVDIRLSPANHELPAIVILSADSGPLRMHFGMNAEQAREMAQALIAAAVEIEAQQVAA